jgi:hypothetical protein
VSVIDWALVLIWISAVPQTLFIGIYGLTNHWWLSWIGRALFASSFGLALLLDLSLFQYYFPTVLGEQPWLTNVILVIVAAGANLKLFALLLDKLPGSRRRFELRGNGRRH